MNPHDDVDSQVGPAFPQLWSVPTLGPDWFLLAPVQRIGSSW